MLSKEEYKKFFDSIADKEKEMTFFLRGIIKQVEDKNLLSILEKIALEENKHYASVKNLLDSSLQKVEAERRDSTREYHLGDIKMENLKDNSLIMVKCVDISLTGAGIEVGEKLNIGDEFKLEINLFNYTETFHAEGKLIWFRPGDKDLYKGGIQYKTK